ncbi:hypothetical protein G6F32_014037 [Rhizopus arrhizus]|nr:hypothetical protein G6F32_014037 [Rhizopus arrhizus]
MLVVALVAVIATALLTRQSAQLRMLRGDQLRAQVRMTVDASLERAAQQLREDAREQVTTVRDGRWARPLQSQVPLPAGPGRTARVHRPVRRAGAGAGRLRLCGRAHTGAPARWRHPGAGAPAARIIDRAGLCGVGSAGRAGAGTAHRGAAGADPGQCQHLRSQRAAGGHARGRTGAPAGAARGAGRRPLAAQSR